MLNSVLVIEDKEYLISLSCEYNDIMYYFLINIADKNDFKYCYQKNGKFMEILDADEVFKISQIFAKKIVNEIN